MLGTGAQLVPNYIDDRIRTVPIVNTNPGLTTNFQQRGERIIPIETTYPQARV